MNPFDQLNLREISTCEVCGNDKLTPVLNLGLHPMCDDLVAVGDPRICKEYPIEILFCDRCYTAHQRYQIPKDELFPKTYHYRSRFTADVLKGMADLVASCKSEFGSLSGKKVLDIGCNDGSLLDIFRFEGADTYGIEPTDAAAEAAAKEHNVTNAFLDVESAKAFVLAYGKMDFVCFTNVFAHIEDLKGVIVALKLLVHEETILVIENHYLGAVLDGSQFDTFYHEHPRTYSYRSFVYIAQSLGLVLWDVQFPSRYGGNIRVYIGQRRKASHKTDEDRILRREAGFAGEFLRMNDQIKNWQRAKKDFVADYNRTKGKLIAKAFPGRAAILVKLLGLTENEIECVFEKPGSMKIGHYLPGTRIPIASDNELFAQNTNDSLILNLAWHINKEIAHYLNDNGYHGEVVDILSKEDIKALV